MEAIRGNPGFDQAYAELADIQAHDEKPGEALKTVTEGLRHVPGSKPLKRRYTELGGKLPYPEPIAPAPAEPQAAQPDEVASPGPASPAEPAVGGPVEATAVAPVAQPKIGSPDNPYCRFCPD